MLTFESRYPYTQQHKKRLGDGKFLGWRGFKSLQPRESLKDLSGQNKYKNWEHYRIDKHRVYVKMINKVKNNILSSGHDY